MNRLIILLAGAVLLVTNPIWAQSEADIKAMQEKMWKAADPDADLTTVPAKWAGESAVILYKKINYALSKELPDNLLHERTESRTRVKLLDKAAVQQYSQLTFDGTQTNSFGNNFGGGEVFVGIKVVKPNGQETEVQVDNTALMELKQGFFENNYQKIAVPDLEPGDIIDYYHCVHKSGLPTATFFAFNQIFYPLPEEYPTVKQKIDLVAQPRFYFNARSLNGAPEFKKVQGTNSGEIKFSLVDTDRDKAEEKRWDYVYRSQPTIKLQAYYGASPAVVSKNDLHYFMGAEGQLKNAITPDELLTFVNQDLTAWPTTGSKITKRFFRSLILNFKPLDNSWSKDILAFINQQHPTETDPETISREAYYYFRQMSYAQNYENQVLYDQGASDGVSDYVFVRNMSRVLEKKNIDHDIIITSFRHLSAVNEAVIPTELTMIIRVNGKKPFYITNFSRYSNFNDLDTNYQGNDGLAININPTVTSRSIKPVSIPVISAEVNAETVKLEAVLDSAEANLLHVTRNSAFRGANRFAEQDWWLTPYDYIEACRSDKYNINPLAETGISASLKTDIRNRMEMRQQEDQQNRQQSLKSRLTEDYAFNIVKVDEVKILQPGIWDDAPALTTTDKFQTDELVSKVGENYLVDIGRLIGGQMELQKKEMDRKEPVYMPYARSYSNTISLTIPEGYETKGLEKLNYNVTTNAGGFISTARLEGNIVVVTTKKYYANNYEPASEWANLAKFMDASYEFTQQKILLRKK